MQGHILSRTFCKRSEQQVRKLVAGPGVYICDRCTELAHAIIHEGGPPASVGPLWQRVGRPSASSATERARCCSVGQVSTPSNS